MPGCARRIRSGDAAAVDEYIRLRPGFNLLDYPEEVNPDTLRASFSIGRSGERRRKKDLGDFSAQG